MRRLAAARARASPAPLRASARASWLRRWTALVGVAAQDCLAATLVDDVPVDLDGADAEPPPEVAVWLDGRVP